MPWLTKDIQNNLRIGFQIEGYSGKIRESLTPPLPATKENIAWAKRKIIKELNLELLTKD